MKRSREIGHSPNDDREQSRMEEAANSISHGLGLLAVVVGTPFLIVQAAGKGNVGYIVGASLFCASAIFLYLSSTVYHALPAGRHKNVFRLFDHCAIFLLIAGTYTPFTLGVLRGTLGWTLFGIVWCLAAAGVSLKLLGKASHPIFSISLYLLMGWLVVSAGKTLLSIMLPAGMLWLLAGGLFYTVGVIFYIKDAKLKFGHFIWHLFVTLGTASHYFAVLWYAS